MFFDYCNTRNYPLQLPCSHILVCNFISHLFQSGFQPSTILSHVSAISYAHKLLNKPDPTHSFVVRKLLQGAQKLGKSADSRLPITQPILHKLIEGLSNTVANFNDMIMLTAIFLLAYSGFMRLGELVPRASEFNSKVLQRQDVYFTDSWCVHITLRHSKNMKDNRPVTIIISSKPGNPLCPVSALRHYVQLFNHTSGPLFCFKSGIPVSHRFVTSNLYSKQFNLLV